MQWKRCLSVGLEPVEISASYAAGADLTGTTGRSNNFTVSGLFPPDPSGSRREFVNLSPHRLVQPDKNLMFPGPNLICGPAQPGSLLNMAVCVKSELCGVVYAGRDNASKID